MRFGPAVAVGYLVRDDVLAAIAVTVHVLCATLGIPPVIEEQLAKGMLASFQSLKWFVPSVIAYGDVAAVTTTPPARVQPPKQFPNTVVVNRCLDFGVRSLIAAVFATWKRHVAETALGAYRKIGLESVSVINIAIDQRGRADSDGAISAATDMNGMLCGPAALDAHGARAVAFNQPIGQ